MPTTSMPTSIRHRTSEELLDDTFAALANQTRRAILARLSKGEATVNELAEPFDISLPAVSKHIAILEKVGLVTRGQRAQYRPCGIDAAPLAAVSSWTDHYRPIWEGRFDQLDTYLSAVQASSNPPPTHPNMPQETKEHD